MFGARQSAFFLISAAIFVLCGCSSSAKGLDYRGGDPGQGGATGSPPARTISFETDEGTWMSVDVSPDGETLVFDMLGDIYLLPIAGGEAVPLTSGRPWDLSPRFSPEGTHVYFLSDRRGYKNVWRVALADRSVEQVSNTTNYIGGGINWSSDGKRLLVGSGRQNNAVALHSIDPESGSMTQVYPRKNPGDADNETPRMPIGRKVYSGAGSPYEKLFFSEAPSLYDSLAYPGARISVFDPATGDLASLTPDDRPYDEFMPQLSKSGNLLSYFRQYSDRRTELRLRNMKTSEDNAITELKDHDDILYTSLDGFRPNYAFTPDDRYVVFSHGGKLQRVRVADGHNEIIPFHANVEIEIADRIKPSAKRFPDISEATTIRWPSFSSDGETMVFSAVGFVWVIDVKTQNIRRLTNSDEFEYMPALSPDGSTVAYISFVSTDGEDLSGRLVTADIDGARPRNVLTDTEANFLLPKWSPDGSTIAIVKDPRKLGSFPSVYGWVNSTGGQFVEVLAPVGVDLLGNAVLNGRSVSFNDAGDKLLVSYPRSRTETILVAAGLDGASTKVLAVGDDSVLGISPSPDLKNLVLSGKDNSLWRHPLTEGNRQPVVVSVSAPEARRISRNKGYSIDWQSPSELSFGFGKNAYRYDLKSNARKSIRLAVPLARPKADDRLAFTGARLITMSGDHGAGRVIENGTIIINGMRITQIGDAHEVRIPERTLTIDVAGKTIIPGLLDTHYHFKGGDPSASSLPTSKIEDKTAIAYGLTSAWEPVGAFDDGMAATADLQAAGRVVGPRWSHSTGGGAGGNIDGILTNYDAVLALVEQGKALGIDTLKEYNLPDRRKRQWVALAAREQGIGVVSHIDHFDGFLNRIVDGYTGGDHPYLPAPFYKDVQEILTHSGFIWTPNLYGTPSTVGFDGRFGARPLQAVEYFWREIAATRPEELDKYAKVTGQRRGVIDPGFPYEQHRGFRLGKVVTDVASRGAKIGVSAHNWPASAVHEEMWHLWKGGMTTGDVLRAATMTNAEKIGWQEEIGSLEVGKLADFLILSDNPLDDILNTMSIEYTIQGGVVYDADTTERVEPAAIATIIR